MKKLWLLLIGIVTVNASAQDKRTISLFASASEPAAFGVSYESKFKSENKILKSYIINIAATALTLENQIYDITGSGFLIDFGNRKYFKNEVKGFYTENFLTYGQIKFDEMVLGVKVDGKYSYWSIINPNIGYRINIGDFAIDPSIGCNWKWEVKGKGIVDNKDFDNFVFRAGLKLGYSF